jgi:uncharacterized membrane protein
MGILNLIYRLVKPYHCTGQYPGRISPIISSSISRLFTSPTAIYFLFKPGFFIQAGLFIVVSVLAALGNYASIQKRYYQTHDEILI